MYPIMVNLTNRPVTIVGGGKVAFRKYKKLINDNPKLTVISPEIDSRFDLDKINWVESRYKKSLIRDADLILACTDDAEVNQAVYQDATANQLVNNTSNKKNSDFYNVSTVEQDGFVYSISSNGKDPFATKQKRRALEEWLRNN
ncbi:precorrin-2 dehydrogenase/sirohydrochlorin ferrochelatase family protein [Companilactobacillus ginsenosidimutans]|uniref:precorrin-2 dehydrogenase n=1 Tax=Companilactobacillus ginsenosidimutans TaxID=1007676 RepID=A0A0H4QHU1_9LACO|nr:bifunctional precorrin-2 dehydrogenase/sirohydrochlorin ferrochelatase [Companilactobacillus ginsenosidimutans]AKP66223.1 siroheme synthase [Companilactobacillus ginsenosidimutans]